MVEESAEQLLARARALLPAALSSAQAALATKRFATRWAGIVSKIETLPSCLSNLSTHPCFSKTPLCRELIESISNTLSQVMQLSNDHPLPLGNLHMKSELDALASKLELNLHDCNLLVKTGALGHNPDLLARLQLGDADAKRRALDGLLFAMHEDHEHVLADLGLSGVTALTRLLTNTTLMIKEKAVTVLCLLAESGSCECLLVSEDVLRPLLKLAESGSAVCREKSVMSLQRLSTNPDAARLVVALGGVRPLISLCELGDGDSITQSAAAATLKNLSTVPELKQSIPEIARVMITLLQSPISSSSKQHAAEFLKAVTSCHENLKSSVIPEEALPSLISYLDEPFPQEPAVSALKNLVSSVSAHSLVSLGLFPRLQRVLKGGTPGAKQAAASTIFKLSSSVEIKELVGESGVVPLLVNMLDADTNGAREAAAQAIASLMSGCHKNQNAVKKNEKSCVPSLVHLLDWNPHNTAKKYAVSCLLCLSSSRKCRRLMVSHGAIGYLKKLTEMGVPGGTELLERLQRGKIKNFFNY
ncbi:hypothetical protein J5N97_029255 [Dioscorea zingiberensis]|uniref:DUF7032 domain-containing protein n=1 Tax=Dioscorea zingiberensis TaxID=325984 RepID=A0A9D5C107_9LILI|nr:hypothetical protein J5N97_029255 [Dioscorea zingiberensis]